MIEKEFAPYQEALALKELGFNEECFGKYLSSLQSNWKVYELILEMGMNEEFEDNRNTYLLEEACSSPTYSQAFRWFRDNYGLLSFIDMDVYSFYRFNIYKGKGISVASHKTYEEAELECLRKLIEIVKVEEINRK